MNYNKPIYIFIIIFFISIWIPLFGCAQTSEDYYNEGNVLYNQKDYDSAIDKYKKSLSQAPRLNGAFNNLANIYLHQKEDYEQAEQICLEGLSYYPFDDSLVLIMMYIDFELGRIDKGISKYMALSQQDLSYTITLPTDSYERAMKDRGSSTEEIVQSYVNLLQINPNDFRLLYKVAEYRKDKGNYKEALDFYKKVTELDPHKEVAYVGMGSCYYNLGQPAVALEYFSKARKAGQFVPDAFFEKLERELNSNEKGDE